MIECKISAHQRSLLNVKLVRIRDHSTPALLTIEGYCGKDAGKHAGWYPDKSGQPKWNFHREHCEAMFQEARLPLWPNYVVEKLRAKNFAVCFIGIRKTDTNCHY